MVEIERITSTDIGGIIRRLAQAEQALRETCRILDRFDKRMDSLEGKLADTYRELEREREKVEQLIGESMDQQNRLGVLEGYEGRGV